MTVAISFNLGKDPLGLREIFGLQVAIFNWFRAFFRYSSQEEVFVLVDDKASLDSIRECAAAAGFDEKRLVALDRRFVQENFTRFDTIFRPDPYAQQLFWQRQLTNAHYTFCGIAHAIGGLETGELLEQYCLDPTESTDAIVSPSRAVASAIRTFWDLYGDYLEQRFGAKFRCPVQLPTIPLGVDIERFENLTSPDKRADQRQKLGLTDDDTAVLWVGRLSHAIKAHPLSMFQAAERAAEISGKSVHLLVFGYFIEPADEPHFTALADDMCRKAKVTFISNKDPRFPEGVWAAGDIFISLIDNMQESFGLTPIEAMAAGLPRVITDWDGYRDGVTDGVDGFSIPTLQPPPGSGGALSALLLTGREMYGGFLAKTALSVAVDQRKAGEAIAKLVMDKNLRRTMADKAKARAKSTYDWKHVIPAYEALWEEMAAKRKREAATIKRPKWPSVLPECPDPFTMYAAYPTSTLKETDRLSVIASADEIKRLWKHSINLFGLDMMIHPDETTKLIAYVSAQNVSIGDVLRQFASCDRAALWRTLGWLIKLGVLGHTKA
jgi:glycosyltransferase involved in cell wall biosynthesis